VRYFHDLMGERSTACASRSSLTSTRICPPWRPSSPPSTRPASILATCSTISSDMRPGQTRSSSSCARSASARSWATTTTAPASTWHARAGCGRLVRGSRGAITDGPRPIEVRAAGVTRRVDPPIVQVTDTVGAGDTFAGAFLAAIVRAGVDRASLATSAVIVAAAAFAARASALVCGRKGAGPPTLGELGDWPRL
jgi:hypothetical protein